MTRRDADDGVFILASASPRRHELMRGLGVPFEVVVSDAPEPVRETNEACEQYAVRMALGKARAVAAQHPGRWVLGADTIVVIDDMVLGKPSDAEDARQMLRSLSGRAHEVHTGVALVRSGGGDSRAEHTAVATTQVRFRDLTDDEIDRYVATDEPLDKAGAYGIQGQGGALVSGYSGSHTNVVGLPVELVAEMLSTHTLMPVKQESLDGLRAAGHRFT
ncbi:MAG: septum formation inhibitor Maf [Armatimonadetes bacterium]|nr:septum formation inhibitor Maf [Armatimonadota bacterium]MDI9583826.1 Maf family protein [Acidobacteriota bacterium]